MPAPEEHQRQAMEVAQKAALQNMQAPPGQRQPSQVSSATPNRWTLLRRSNQCLSGRCRMPSGSTLRDRRHTPVSKS